MNTKPPRFTFSALRLLTLGMLAPLLLAFTCGAMAAPKVCRKNCPPLPQAEDNYAFWGEDEATSLFYEFGSRTCSLAQLAPDLSSGTYDCQLHAPAVTYILDGVEWQQIYKRGIQYYCDRADRFYYAFPDLQYSYSWAGDCTGADGAGGCTVTIVNRFAANTGSAYGSITIEAFKEGVQTTDPNPFSTSHVFEPDYIHVTKFAPKGKDKVLAICLGTPDPGMVTFNTLVVPAETE